MLKEGEEILFIHPLPTARVERLYTVKEGCEKVLVDLQNLVEKYGSLGSQSKRTWDRMRWCNEDVAEIRARLTSNVSLLTAFISTSQVSVKTKLDEFIEEFRQGKKETSIVSLQTVDSLSADDRAIWRTIRKELEEIGISVAAFDANRDFIFDWFVRAVEAGAFEEQNAYSTDDERQYSDEQECESSEADDDDDDDMERKIQDSDSESLKSIHGGQQLEWQQSSKSAHESESFSPKSGSTSLVQVSASTHPQQRSKRRVPRIAAFVAGISRSRQRLMKAVTRGDFSKALNILKDQDWASALSFRLLDTGTLDRALWSAIGRGEIYDSYPLLAQLIAQGANVNYVSSDISERTPLWISVEKGSFGTVRLLVENGVDLNYKGLNRPSNRGEACDFAPRAALQQSTAILRLLISSGADVNVLYTVPPHSLSVEFSIGKVTLIHEAAILGAVSALEALLEIGAEIDAVSPGCSTPLMYASLNQQEPAAKLLLARGANSNFQADSGLFDQMRETAEHYRTPIEAAIYSGKASMVRLLLDHGAVSNASTLAFARSLRRRHRSEMRIYYRADLEEKQKITEMLTEALDS